MSAIAIRSRRRLDRAVKLSLDDGSLEARADLAGGNTIVYINALPKRSSREPQLELVRTCWRGPRSAWRRAGREHGHVMDPQSVTTEPTTVSTLADRAGLPCAVIVRTARLLKQYGLLRNAESKAPSHDPPRHN